MNTVIINKAEKYLPIYKQVLHVYNRYEYQDWLKLTKEEVFAEILRGLKGRCNPQEVLRILEEEV